MPLSAPPPLKIGTRGSPLALAQAHLVRDALVAAHGVERLGGVPEFVIVRTSGDAIQDRPLRDVGGKGLFTREIEDQLLSGAIDLAVHSAKDMPTIARPGLALAGALPREDVRDVLIARGGGGLDALPSGARIGTASLRRQAQLLRRRPDLVVEDLRGNVGTRIAKLEAGVVDAIVLARAGLARLGLAIAGAVSLETDVMLPAAGQGTIGLEIRDGDKRLAPCVAAISDTKSLAVLRAERALLGVLNGSCRSPIGAYCTIEGDQTNIAALVLTPDGREAYGARRRGPAGAAEELAIAVGEAIRLQAPPAFVAALLSGD